MPTRDIVVSNQFATIQSRLAILLGLRNEEIRRELQYGWEHGIRTEWLIDFIRARALNATRESYQRDACHGFLLLIYGTILFPYSSNLIDGALAQVVLQVVGGHSYVEAVLVETIRSLDYVREARRGRMRGSPHLFQIWLLAHIRPFGSSHPFSCITDERSLIPESSDSSATNRTFLKMRIALHTSSRGQTLQLHSRIGFYGFGKFDDCGALASFRSFTSRSMPPMRSELSQLLQRTWHSSICTDSHLLVGYTCHEFRTHCKLIFPTQRAQSKYSQLKSHRHPTRACRRMVEEQQPVISEQDMPPMPAHSPPQGTHALPPPAPVASAAYAGTLPAQLPLPAQNRASLSYTPPPERRTTVDPNPVAPPIYVTNSEDVSFLAMTYVPTVYPVSDPLPPPPAPTSVPLPPATFLSMDYATLTLPPLTIPTQPPIYIVPPPTVPPIMLVQAPAPTAFEAYATEWRGKAAKHIPPISEIQQVQLFHSTLKGVYYSHHLSHASSFFELIEAGKKLDMGIKLARIEGPTSKKEGEAPKKQATGTSIRTKDATVSAVNPGLQPR
ncbi:hypothetical protein CRG98_013300 [Punica granatum]|uniref:DUF7745 domain-containing protein n=1 Tax=Punica granatum TaxID=22663 RepID=A0A2I0KCR9_PUNGR|nr:hypothetical protein CRG98_013300 [Punica granatum]